MGESTTGQGTRCALPDSTKRGVIEWHGLYRAKWGRDRLQPESFAHPAKAAYGLAVRIAEHLLEQGYIQSSTILPVSRSVVEYITCPRNYIHVQIVESQGYKVSGVLPVQERREQEPRLPNARQEHAPYVETNSPTYQVSTRHTVVTNVFTRETAGVSQSCANNAEMDSPLMLLTNANTAQIPATKRPLLATNINEEKNRSTEPTNLAILESAALLTGSGEADAVSSTTECSGKRPARSSEMKLENAKSAGRLTTSKSTIKSPIGIARTIAEKTWQYYVLPVTEKLISLLIEQYPKYFPLGKRAWLENRKTVTFAYLIEGDSIILIGDTVLDPFGGIGGFALPLIERGVNVVLVELEQRFNDMAQGCECTGISKADWVRFQGRYDKARYLDGRHWCPRCVMQAQTIPPRKFNPFKFSSDEWAMWNDRGFHQPTLFGSAGSATYERNSGRIPCTEPHHYTGNLEAWNEAGYEGRAVMLQGDSRHLCEVLGRAGFVGAVSSPPYAHDTEPHGDLRPTGTRFEKLRGYGIGKTVGQLASLPEGDAPQVQAGAVVGSPPFSPPGSQMIGQHQGTRDYYHEKGTVPEASFSSGNLGNLPAGEPPAAVVSSMPYVNSLKQEGQFQEVGSPGYTGLKAMSDGYSRDPTNLGNLPIGEPPCAAVVASPPYTASLASDDPDKRGGLFRDPKRRGDRNMTGEYGASEGQIGAMREGEPPSAVVASMPYAHSAIAKNSSGVDLSKQYVTYRKSGGGQSFEAFCATQRLHSQEYGASAGQLGAMAEGQPVAPVASVSSPPFGDSLESKDRDFQAVARPGRTIQCADYGATDGQLGTESGTTFWAASAVIMRQVYQVLAPGAVAVWVCKSFIRAGQVVPFPEQWAALGEACGFKTIEWIRCWLVEDRGAQYTLNGDLSLLQAAYKSFFRRLSEKRGSPEINFEVVLIQRKPDALPGAQETEPGAEADTLEVLPLFAEVVSWALEGSFCIDVRT